MGLIDMIKPLSTVLSSAVVKSWQHQENNSQRQKLLGMPRIKPGAAGCKLRKLSIVLCGPPLLRNCLLVFQSSAFLQVIGKREEKNKLQKKKLIETFFESGSLKSRFFAKTNFRNDSILFLIRN